MTNHPAQEELLARLTDLECRVAFQDDTIEQLNQVIVRQADQIDALSRLTTKLAEQVKNLLPLLMAAPGDEPPPPHY